MTYKCPDCNKTIGLMPAEDVYGKKTNLPSCPYAKRNKRRR